MSFFFSIDQDNQVHIRNSVLPLLKQFQDVFKEPKGLPLSVCSLFKTAILFLLLYSTSSSFCQISLISL